MSRRRNDVCKQLPKEDPNEKLSELRKRLQLLEGEKKANYEEAEEEKKKNEALIRKLKIEIVELKEKREHVGKNERLMRDALEGQATGTDAHQKIEPAAIIEPKNNRLGDLTNQLNRLKANAAMKKRKLEAVMSTFQDSVVDNIIYEENRQPDEVRLRELNNQIDCVSKKMLEAQHVQDKYQSVIGSLRAEQTMYESRLQLMQQRLEQAEDARRQVKRTREYAETVRDSAQDELQTSQTTSAGKRQERDAVLAKYKRQADIQRAEYHQLRRQLFLGGAYNTMPGESSAALVTTRRLSEMIDDKLGGLYDQSKEVMVMLGARSIEDVVRLFEMQQDTSKQLNMVWKEAELNIKRLKKIKQELELELERMKYADNIEEMRAQNRCAELRLTIAANMSRKEKCDARIARINNTLGNIRTGMTHMIGIFQETGLSVLKLTASGAGPGAAPPALSDLFTSVTAAAQFVMEPLQTVNVPQMMLEMDAEDFFVTKEEQHALGTKIRAQPPVQPPGKKRFSFLLLDRPDVIDEGPGVKSRAQIKRHAQIMLEARTKKIRPPTARDKRREQRRRSTIIDRPLQAMT